jgi:hypothetical protein
MGEFFSRQPIIVCFLEEQCVDLFEFVPIARGRQIYFQNSGVGSDAEGSQPRIGRRRVALQPNRHPQILTRILDSGHQVEIVREIGCIRQKHVQTALSILHAKRWTDQLRRSFSCARQSGQRVGHGISLEEIHPAARA